MCVCVSLSLSLSLCVCVSLSMQVVLDVGAGSGILSFFAVQAGARRVYAVEASSIAVYCQQLVQSNRVADKIFVIAGKIEEVQSFMHAQYTVTKSRKIS